MGTGVIEAERVGKKFGEFSAIKDFSLRVEQGECLGLLGPNGAGKSTFIGILYGVVQRTEGELRVFGRDPSHAARVIKRQLGIVPQENALDEALTVEENMVLFSRFKGLGKKEAAPRVNELLAYMNLEHKKDAKIQSLSGGMKRRLAFVRALLSNPELLILDEPTTGLDPAVRHLLWQRVEDIRRDGKTILVSTHYMHEAEVLCDRVVVMNRGVLVDAGTPKALIAKHSPGFVGIFVENKNLGAHLQKLPKNFVVTKRGDSVLIRSPGLEDLMRLQTEIGAQAVQLRPANLEDVFLKITGEELSSNA